MTEANFYRVFTVDRYGHIIEATTFESRDDEEAIEKAEQLLDDQVLELWRGAKLIRRFDPKSKS